MATLTLPGGPNLLLRFLWYVVLAFMDLYYTCTEPGPGEGD
jgi:hypothetical protein